MARTKVVRSLTVMVALVSLFAVLLGNVAAAPVEGTGGDQAPWAPRDISAALYASWIAVYKQVAPGIAITYTPVGSGQARRTSSAT